MQVNLHRRPALAAAALVALAGLTGPAAAGCGSATVFACGVRSDSVTALPVSATSVTTVLPLRTDDDGLAARLYGQLVPKGYAVPAEKAVAVQLTRYDLGRCRQVGGANGAPATVPAPPCGSLPPQPGTTTWVEGHVSLRVALGDDIGWLPLSAPFSSADRRAAAAAAGIPAYAATGEVVLTEAGATARASLAGSPTVAIAFERSSQAVPASVAALSTGAASVFSVVPALTGAQRWRTSQVLSPTVPATDLVEAPVSTLLQPGATMTGTPVRGTATVTLAPVALPVPGRTLADLVVLSATGRPAVLRAEDGTLVTKRDNLDDGQDGPVPAAPPSSSAVFVAGPGAQTTSTAALGYLTPVVVTTRGSAGVFHNADVTSHTVTSRESGPDGRPLFDGYADSIRTDAVVKGVADLPPGSYGFLCSLHPAMTGTLVVL